MIYLNCPRNLPNWLISASMQPNDPIHEEPDSEHTFNDQENKENKPVTPPGGPSAINMGRPVVYVDNAKEKSPTATALAQIKDKDNSQAAFDPFGKPVEVDYDGVHIPSNHAAIKYKKKTTGFSPGYKIPTKRSRSGNLSTEAAVKKIALDTIEESMKKYIKILEEKADALTEITKKQAQSNESGFRSLIALSTNAQKTAIANNNAIQKVLTTMSDGGSSIGSSPQRARPIASPEDTKTDAAPAPARETPSTITANKTGKRQVTNLHLPISHDHLQYPGSKCSYCADENHIGSQCPVYPDGFSRQILLFNEKRCAGCGKRSDFEFHRCRQSRERCIHCPATEKRAYHMPSACQWRHKKVNQEKVSPIRKQQHRRSYRPIVQDRPTRSRHPTSTQWLSMDTRRNRDFPIPPCNCSLSRNTNRSRIRNPAPAILLCYHSLVCAYRLQLLTPASSIAIVLLSCCCSLPPIWKINR